jgi:hypothetical protein
LSNAAAGWVPACAGTTGLETARKFHLQARDIDLALGRDHRDIEPRQAPALALRAAMRDVGFAGRGVRRCVVVPLTPMHGDATQPGDAITQPT